MRRILFALVATSCLSACARPPSWDGIEMGATLDEVRMRHPDLTRAQPGADDTDVPDVKVQLPEKLDRWTREPGGDIRREAWLFSDGRLVAVWVEGDSAALRRRIEAENGAPTIDQGAPMGAHVTVWEGRGREIALFQSQLGTQAIIASQAAPVLPWVVRVAIGAMLLATLLPLRAARDRCSAFLASTRSITTSTDLERFKDAAGAAMKANLAAIVLPIPGAALFAWGMFAGWFGCIEIVVFVLLGSTVTALARRQKGFEEDVRSVPVAPELATAHAAVLETWRKKPLPDW